MLILNEKQLSELNAFLMELPMKYALPLTQWFNKIQEEQTSTSTESKKETLKKI